MAGKKTSIYLSEDLAERVDASGLSIPELIRRGLQAGHPDPLETSLARIVRDEISEALADQADTIGRRVRDEITNARGYG